MEVPHKCLLHAKPAPSEYANKTSKGLKKMSDDFMTVNMPVFHCTVPVRYMTIISLPTVYLGKQLSAGPLVLILLTLRVVFDTAKRNSHCRVV